MNKFTLWVLRKICRNVVRQGGQNQRIQEFFEVLAEAARKEYTEDNDSSLSSYLIELQEKAHKVILPHVIEDKPVEPPKPPYVEPPFIPVSGIKLFTQLAPVTLRVKPPSIIDRDVENLQREILEAKGRGETSVGLSDFYNRKIINELEKLGYNVFEFTGYEDPGTVISWT